VTTEQSQPAGLRERKKAESRLAIVNAALRLFHKRGYGNVTIDEIADLANVSRRSFFRYFPTKEDVVLERRRSQLEAFRQALTSAPRSVSSTAIIRSAFALVADDYRRNKARILSERALFLSARELRVRDLEIDREFEAAMVDAVVQRSGSRASELRAARFFAAAVMGVVRVVVDEWAAGGGVADIVDLGAPALDTISALLPTP